MERQEWREPMDHPPTTSSCSGGSDERAPGWSCSWGLSRAPRPELCPRRAVSLPPKPSLCSSLSCILNRFPIVGAIRLAFHRPEGLGAICRLGKFMLFLLPGKKKKKDRLLHKMDSSTFLQEGWSHLSGRRPPAPPPRPFLSRCKVCRLSEPAMRRGS